MDYFLFQTELLQSQIITTNELKFITKQDLIQSDLKAVTKDSTA
jgi:hypothetical protein